MNLDRIAREAGKIAKPYRITNGKGFRLRDIDTTVPKRKAVTKAKAKAAMALGLSALQELQERLYAQDRWSVLLVFQAMDAAGKDGAIKHVMSGVNPQGCQVYSFKAPTSEDLDHDYLWRCTKALPERGRIGIFNRSYYEETLVVRVHPEILEKQKLPRSLVSKHIWDERFEDINALERYLSRNGTKVCKFFLNVSKDEQKKRFQERLDRPDKHWKFSASDAAEREHWDDYMKAYEAVIKKTASPEAPWYVIPADQKWYARLIVAAAVVHTLHGLDLQFPKVTIEKRAELDKARRSLK
jgi:PPK2 family polyphosphate:nucleotide phosphotransferase